MSQYALRCQIKALSTIVARNEENPNPSSKSVRSASEARKSHVASRHVFESELLNAIRRDLPVTLCEPTPQALKPLLCVVNTYQRTSEISSRMNCLDWLILLDVLSFVRFVIYRFVYPLCSRLSSFLWYSLVDDDLVLILRWFSSYHARTGTVRLHYDEAHCLQERMCCLNQVLIVYCALFYFLFFLSSFRSALYVCFVILSHTLGLVLLQPTAVVKHTSTKHRYCILRVGMPFVMFPLFVSHCIVPKKAKTYQIFVREVVLIPNTEKRYAPKDATLPMEMSSSFLVNKFNRNGYPCEFLLQSCMSFLRGIIFLLR
jgi:hypothetical protein